MTKITLTAKIQLKLDDADKECLLDTMSAYRDGCNYVSDYIYCTKCISSHRLHHRLYQRIRRKFGLGSQMAENVIRTVRVRYEAMLTDGVPWERIRFKKLQRDLVYKSEYRIEKDGLISINRITRPRLEVSYYPKANGYERLLTHSPEYKFGTARLVYRKGKLYIHIPIDFNVPECDVKDITNVVGIDRGINFLMTTYDGSGKTFFANGRCVKQKRAHYKELRAELQRKGTPSFRRRLKAIGRRENCWMNDVNHQISKTLVDRYPASSLFVLEDLTGVSDPERVWRGDRSLLVSWSFYDLEKKIEYKAKHRGAIVIKVRPEYTSQQCPVCGYTDKDNRIRPLHMFRCKCCGYTSNDDRVAAINLYNKGIRCLSDGKISKVRL